MPIPFHWLRILVTSFVHIYWFSATIRGQRRRESIMNAFASTLDAKRPRRQYNIRVVCEEVEKSRHGIDTPSTHHQHQPPSCGVQSVQHYRCHYLCQARIRGHAMTRNVPQHDVALRRVVYHLTREIVRHRTVIHVLCLSDRQYLRKMRSYKNQTTGISLLCLAMV